MAAVGYTIGYFVIEKSYRDDGKYSGTGKTWWPGGGLHQLAQNLTFAPGV